MRTTLVLLGAVIAWGQQPPPADPVVLTIGGDKVTKSQFEQILAGLPEQQQAARKVREALSVYQQSEDLIQLGAYAAGADPKLDASIRVRGELLEFLRQDAHTQAPREETLERLTKLATLLP